MEDRQEAVKRARQAGYKDITASTNRQFEKFEYFLVLKKGSHTFGLRSIEQTERFLEKEEEN